MSEGRGHPRTVIIAQARMGSTRLPGKVMMDICGKPMVDHIVERAKRSTLADDVVVAIPDLPEDDVLAEHVADLDVRVVRGSADDVLARYVKAAEESGAEVIVRITCDCPLIDPAVIDRVIERYRGSDVDYCSNILERTYPIGMDTEAFSREALKRAHVQATEPHEREHVTPYIWQRPGEFQLENVEAPSSACAPDLRLAVDEAVDLQLMRIVCSRIEAADGVNVLVRMAHEHRALFSLNAMVRHRFIE